MINIREQFVRYLVFGVAVLGLLSTTVLLSDPPTASELNPSLFNLNYKAHATSRVVASLPSAEVVKDTIFEVNCNDQGQKVETPSPRFRLFGQACTDDSAALSTQILNRSNGYIATVFHRDPQSFTTDYINLNEGQNEIAVTFITAKGPVEKTITITRNSLK